MRLDIGCRDCLGLLNGGREFTGALTPDARIKVHLFPLVLQFIIPLHFNMEWVGELQGVKETNQLPHGVIDKARWIEPKQCWAVNQTCSHALITFTTPEVRHLQMGL